MSSSESGEARAQSCETVKVIVRERTFGLRRQDGWEELELLLRTADRSGARNLDAGQLRRMALLYRSTTTDLAAAQTRGYSPELRAYLNRLTARAHAFVHAGAAQNGWTRLVQFFSVVFPREFRRSAPGASARCVRARSRPHDSDRR